MTKIALGPSHVTIDTWESIEYAVAQGLLHETRYCELKKALPPGSRSNVELGRDLASMGIHGGAIFFGIEDAGSGQAGRVVGVQEPSAVKQRIVAVAAAGVQPSLHVDVEVVPHRTEDIAVVVAIVPPSSVAPHQVDERYWGRSAEGKQVLADPDVERLFGMRRNRQNDFEARLVQASSLNPLPDSANGLLTVYARPAQGSDFGGSTLVDPMEAVRVANIPSSSHGWGAFDSLTYQFNHPRGLCRQSNSFENIQPGSHQYVQRMLIEDSGALSYVALIASISQPEHGHIAPTALIYERVDGVMRVVGALSSMLPYSGVWELGLSATQLLGASVSGSWGPTGSYPEPEYRKTVTATAASLDASPEEVTRQLVQGLARAFGEDHLFPYTTTESFFHRRL